MSLPVGGVQTVAAQRDVHLPQASLQQLLRRTGSVGVCPDGHAAEQLRLYAVGLQRRQAAQHRLELGGLDSGYRVGQQGGGAVLAQPVQRRFRQIRLHHHQIGVVDVIQPLAQEVRRHVVVDGHIVDRQRHVTIAVVDEQVGAGAPVGDDGAVGQVEADGGGVLPHALGEAVLSQHRDHGDLLAQQTQVVGDVAPHAAQRRGDPAGIGVPRHQRRMGHRADVHIHTAHHHDIRVGAQQIAAPGDVALFHQAGDVYRRAGAGDPRLFSQLLLGDHGVFPDPLQQLPFPLGHGIAS